MLSRRELLWPFGRRAEPAPAPPVAAVAPPLAVVSPAPRARGFAGRGVPGATPLPATLVPRVDPARCMATRMACAACVERCPAPGAMRWAGPMPEVVAAACTGCGQCLAVCPAPVLALELQPRRTS